MTAPMPNPFLSEIPRAGSPAPSVSLSARGAGGVSPFKLDEAAFMAALVGWRSTDPNPPNLVRAANSTAAVSEDAAAAFDSNSPTGSPADDVTVAGLAVAPIRTVSAAVTTKLDLNAKNIATLLALAESSTAPASTSSTLVRQ